MKKYKAKGSTLRFFAPYGRLRDFMSEKMTKFKSTFLSVQEGVRRFSYTDWYILLVLAIGVTGWALQNAVVGFVGMVLVSSVVLVLSDDILPLTVNAFGAMLMIYTDKLDEFLKMWPSLIVLVVAIVIFVVRNSVAKIKRKDRFVFGKMFFPQIAISIALLLGGIGTIAVDRYVASLPNVLALGIGVLAIYLLFANFIKRNDEIDYAKYFAKVLMWIGFAVSIQLCVVIAKSGIAPNEWAKAYWNVGWGNRNNIATFFLLTAPMALYLSTRTRRGWAYILMAFWQYACLIMTLSRGGILFGLIALVFGVAFSIYKAPCKKHQLICFAICAVVIIIVGIVFRDGVKGVIKSLMDRVNGGHEGDLSSGRLDLYKEAWEQFKAHPFLGVGMGFIGKVWITNDMAQYWFHSTFFQVLACMGIVGIVAYTYYYVVRIGFCIKMMKQQFRFAFFVFVAWVGFEGYSMIDTGTMSPFPYMMLVAVMTCILEISCQNRNHETDVNGIKDSLLEERYVRDVGIDIVRANNVD